MFKNLNLKIKIFLIGLLSLFACLPAGRFIGLFRIAHASSISLRISPTTIQIQTKAPNNIKTPLNIENRTEQPVELEILLQPFVPKDNLGNVQFGSDFSKKPDPDFLKKITILEDDEPTNKIILGPFKKKNLQLSLRIPAEEQESDYYFSILFISNPPPLSREEKETISQTQVAIASNILITIQNIESIPKGTIEEFSTPLFSQKGPVPFTLRLRNRGNHALLAEGVITIKNMFNQTIGYLDIKKSPILLDSEKILTSDNSLDLSWQNGFLFGPYTANLTLTLSEHGPTFKRTIQFFVLPFKETFETAFIILMIIFVLKRVRKYQ